VRCAAFAVAGALGFLAGAAEARPLRVMALDQCADQYVLELAPDADLALSPRADDPDAWLREQARGRLRVRPTLESAIAFRPDVVVRYWGGDLRLLRRLEASGVKVITIEDVTSFNGVRSEIRSVAEGLRVPGRGEVLAGRMDETLRAARPKAGPVSPRPST